MLLGIIIVTSEFFHQTVTTTFLTTPHRSAVIAAKLAMAGLLGVGFWALTTAANLLVAPIILNSFDSPTSSAAGRSGGRSRSTDWRTCSGRCSASGSAC